MAEKAKRLDRLLRVRTMQLGMVRAEEGRAAARLADEQALRDRVTTLASAVAPTPSGMADTALSVMATAHYRDRLVTTAQTIAERVDLAERALDHARAATQAAKRDQTAMEKLIERAQQEAVRRAGRALERLGEQAPKKRHDIC